MISPRVNTRVWQRSISLLSPQAAKTESNVVTKERTYIKNLSKDIATSRFRLVDENGKIASITVQPDIPICIKKDCLVSIHNLNHLSLSYKWLNFWSNLIKFRSFKSSLFHRIIGSSVLEILAAPNFQTSRRPFDSSRSLSVLNLTGTKDWNVFGKDSISHLNRTPVWKSNRLSFPLQVCGGGLVYSIELIDESDKILVNSRNILAINGQSQLDIANSVERQELHVEGAYVGDSSNDTVAPKFIKNQTLKSAYGHTIKGPRTILIQTHEMTTSKDNILTKLTSKGHVKKSTVNDNGVNLEKQVANDVNSKIIELANRPSLFIATVSQDGRVDFQSTSKFT
ncbi:protein with a role in determining mitochondrial architecture [Saccharomyces cerevisiae]|nr:protein with a role in determining mitochondrial architecture [Saccharomyces cerevisiae]